MSDSEDVTVLAEMPPNLDVDAMFRLPEGTREMVDKARAEALMEPILVERKTHFVGVELGGRSFSVEASVVVSQAVELLENLRVFNIADVIAGRPEDEALEVLSTLCSTVCERRLIEVKLSDNALGEKGVRACAGALKSQRDLERLFFCNNGISGEAVVAITELVTETDNLRTLHFFNNMSGDDGARAIAEFVVRCPKLTDFRFASTRVGEDGGLALAEALPQVPRLSRLDLSDNSFGDDGSLRLAQAIRSLKGLRVLLLRDTGMSPEAFSELCEAIGEVLVGIEELDLSGNDVDASMAKRLGNTLRRTSSLRKLWLEDNPDIRSEGAMFIVQALEHLSSLELLDLSGCEIKRAGAVALAEGVVKAPQIKRLGLNGNMISTEGLDVLHAVLDGASLGSVLGDMEDNDADASDDELPATVDDGEDLANKLEGLAM